jgi:hypothetical protein
MKNITEVIRGKEQEMVRVQKELEALRIVAPLLAEAATDGKSRVLEMPEADDLIDLRLHEHPTA